jgi:hypothetical protein
VAQPVAFEWPRTITDFVKFVAVIFNDAVCIS